MAKNTSESAGANRLFTLIAFALVITALYFAKEILLPIALAILLSFILSPIVKRLERFHVGRVVSVVVVTSLAMFAISAIAWLATNQVVQLSTQLPNYKDNMIEKIRSIRGNTDGKFAEAKEALKDIGEELTEEPDGGEEPGGGILSQTGQWFPWSTGNVESSDDQDAALEVKVVELPPSPLSQIKRWLGPLVAPFSTAGMVIVLVIFILLKQEDLRNRALQLLGTSRLYATTGAIDDATRRLSRYLQMQLLINAMYGVVVGVGLTLIGVPNALLWGVLGMMLRFLPYLGPWISAAMPIILSMAVSDGWIQPLLTLGLFIALEIVVNNIFEPWLYGSSTGISSFGVILAAIFWAWLWGPIGLVVAMPLTVCLIALGKYVPQLSWLPVMLGDDTSLLPHEQMYQRLLTSDDHEAVEMSRSFLQEGGLVEFYEQVMIPALHIAELDRHSDRLSEQQESTVNESARELVELLASHYESDSALDEPSTKEVLCIPVRDQADETTAIMTSQVLRAEGIAVELGSLDLLASEMNDRVVNSDCEIVVLSVLPPLGTRNARYLCKRLRRHNPELTIIVSVFGDGSLSKKNQRLTSCGADVIACNLQDTVTAVRQANKVRQLKKPHWNAEPLEDTASEQECPDPV